MNVSPPTSQINRLKALMKRLRAPDGCAWDRKQTIASLRQFLIEETYETIDTMDAVLSDPSQTNIAHHREELGDLLLQVIFQSEIQSESGHFDFEAVAKDISDKLERRHPHIFGAELAHPSAEEDPSESDANPYWETIKAQEKEHQKDKSILAGIPRAAPSMLRAYKTSQKAAKVGFTWPTIQQVLKDVDEEVEELKEAIQSENRAHIEHELGDAFYALCNVARFLKMDPELSLKSAVDRFEKRFRIVESSYNFDHEKMKIAEVKDLDAAWENAKRATSD